jgi:hypothetical protein
VATTDRPEAIFCQVYRYESTEDILKKTNLVVTSYSTDFALTVGRDYAFEVTCSNRIGQSDRSLVKIKASGPPQPPTKVRSTSVSGTEICIVWSPPEDNGGELVTDYWSTISSNLQGQIKEEKFKVKQTDYCYQNLTPGIQYCFTLQSENIKGISSSSSE